MARLLDDWLKTYIEYASFTEAPKRMHLWTGVATLAGALRRKVWFDQFYFKWYPNFYIIMVAPPGIVSKSSTADIGMRLLRKVPGVKFGPDVVTWQALVTAFAESMESFEYNGEWHTMAALTLSSSEFGNLLDPTDRAMVDLLVNLWDCKQGAFEKVTKGSGKDAVENPWINMIACTTPAWIAGNVPEYVIEGGFTSRCIFIYAEEKAKLSAYPYLHVPAGVATIEEALIHDLEWIASHIVGPYTLSPEALEWGTAWYADHYENKAKKLADSRYGGYIARKQSMLHKLAMVLTASKTDLQIIQKEDMELANILLTDNEDDMVKVFSKIGQSKESVGASRFIQFIKQHGPAGVQYAEALQYVHTVFPNFHDFEMILAGAIKANYIRLEQRADKQFLVGV